MKLILSDYALAHAFVYSIRIVYTRREAYMKTDFFLARESWFPALKIRCVILTDVIQTAVNRWWLLSHVPWHCVGSRSCRFFRVLETVTKSNSPILLAQICVNLSILCVYPEEETSDSLVNIPVGDFPCGSVTHYSNSSKPGPLHGEFTEETPINVVLAGLREVTVFFSIFSRKKGEVKKCESVCAKEG